MDTRTSRNIDKLKVSAKAACMILCLPRFQEDLHDVQQIFRSNIEEILGRGERLESVCCVSRCAEFHSVQRENLRTHCP